MRFHKINGSHGHLHSDKEENGCKLKRETKSPCGLTLVACASHCAAAVPGRKGHLVGPIIGSRFYTGGVHFVSAFIQNNRCGRDMELANYHLKPSGES